ncbi:hypothetical protein BJ138DRAFT_1021044, partial [Hygrophoropsis aurantiaca]
MSTAAENALDQALYHPWSGYRYGTGANTLQRMQDNPFKTQRAINMYYPFLSRADWSLGRFLTENLTQSQINQFLALPWFQDNAKPSFRSASELLAWMDTLPAGPRWQSTIIEVDNYKTTDPISLIWCDGLEVVESIFGDPIFGADMTFDPILSNLPKGSTLVPILAASDKTPVTRMTGGLEMHPLFISIGNIASHIRMAATSHAWRCVAFMPIPKFEVHSEYQTILQTRVWHKCADIVFANLKRAAVHGAIMTDPHGSIRNCYTPLAAWTADLPEQLMISCTAKNASPVTEATHKQFGDAHHYPPRTAELTIQRIHHVGQQTDVWNLDRFQKLAKTMHLSGVSQPFWRDWEYAEPSIFLVPEVLHTCHKFFFDHVLKWCKEVVGKELDSRFKAHHKRISVRHFANGVSHVKQMTGRDHRDIQRTIVPMIAGLVPPDFLRAIRAIIDFIYQSQSPVHTDASIERMESSLREFHTHKDAILRAHGRKTSTGVKDDFFIPKLELLHSFANAVRNNGAIIQYTADVSERLLITHCKHPFERTSKNKDFTTQVTRILDREESMRRFDIYTLLRSSNVALVNAINDEELAVTSANPALAWVSRILPEEQRQIQGPRPCRNYFTGGVLSANAQTALHVTVRSDDMVYSVVDIGTKYHLPDFALQYQRFILAYHHDFQYFLGAFDRFAIWHKFRVQLLSTFRPSMILPSQVVQAKPPSPDIPLGCC